MNIPQERRSPDRQTPHRGKGQSADRRVGEKSQSGDWRSRERRLREYSENFQSGEWFSRGYLPHRDGRELIQHVTFHLADSLPKSAIERIEESLVGMPENRRKTELRKRLDAWVDAGHGSCVLKHSEVAEMVQAALLHFDGKRYRLHAWVVMPNHVHVLFQPIDDWPLAKIVASWKKFTARKIKDFLSGTANLQIGDSSDGEIVTLRTPARANQEIGGPRVTGPVWHREYWDRYIRNERHYGEVVDYIHYNPVAADLVALPEAWPWSRAKYIVGENGQ